VYQFLLEGLLLFVVLWIYSRKPRGRGQVSGVFLIGYGVLRFLVEFFREPDKGLEQLPLGLTMGQWLCVPMVLAGVALWAWGARRFAAGKVD
jgi:phosphatidylglycerol:prolipoprotein diacylglycerol transferase